MAHSPSRRINYLRLLLAYSFATVTIALSSISARAQDEKQVEFERTWYATCYTGRNEDKCYQLSKELLAKYPTSNYAKNAGSIIKNKDLNNAWQKFQAALDAFYKQPPQDATKLEALFAAGSAFHQVEPDQQNPAHLYVLGQMAIAGNQAVSVLQCYKNLDTVKGYAERAIKAFDSAQATEKTKKDFDLYVAPLKDHVMANANQFFGFRLIETKGDQQQALDYLTKATQIKSKDGVGWKDPYNYLLRSTIYFNQYTEIRKSYDAMTEEEKGSEAGKQVLKKINEYHDTKLIPEYARVLATATKPEFKPYYDSAKNPFDVYWDFRTGAKEKAADYIKNFVADPTIAGPAIPVKSDDNLVGPTKKDTTAPKIIISSPEVLRGVGVKTNESRITMTGRAIDESGVAEVLVRGTPARLGPNGAFSADILLETGENRITVTATDVYGNRASENVVINRGIEAPIQPAFPRQGYFALVIGNNNYRNMGRLETAINDANDVAKVLRELYGFQTKVLSDARREDILGAINEYRHTLEEDQSLLIYYAGHGYFDRDADRAYWLPVDARTDNNSNWIIADDLTANIRAIKARHVLIISDSCYSGVIDKDRTEVINLSAPAEQSRYIARMQGRTSRTLMASGGNEPVADGGGGKNSVFANALLRGLREVEESAFSADQLFYRHIRTQVAGKSNQTPEYKVLRNSGHDGGEFVFVRMK